MLPSRKANSLFGRTTPGFDASWCLRQEHQTGFTYPCPTGAAAGAMLRGCSGSNKVFNPESGHARRRHMCRSAGIRRRMRRSELKTLHAYPVQESLPAGYLPQFFSALFSLAFLCLLPFRLSRPSSLSTFSAFFPSLSAVALPLTSKQIPETTKPRTI